MPTTIAGRRLAIRCAAQAPFEISRDAGFAVFPPGCFPEVEEIVRIGRAIDPAELPPQAFILPGNYRKTARFRALATPEVSPLSRLVLGAE